MGLEPTTNHPPPNARQINQLSFTFIIIKPSKLDVALSKVDPKFVFATINKKWAQDLLKGIIKIMIIYNRG